jgi:hypothetical protein
MNGTLSLSPPAQWTDFRLIPRIEAYPPLVRFAQTFAGKVVIWALFAWGLWFFSGGFWDCVPLAGALLLLVLLPQWRWPLMCFCTLGMSAIQFKSPDFLAAVGLGVLLFWCARRWPNSHFAQRPLAYLLAGCALLIVASSMVPGNSRAYAPAWRAVGLATVYVWFIAYALIDRKASPQKDLTLEVGAFRPFWGSTNTPFPKGAAYLRRIEARNDQELAVTQLKGLKLLVWAILLALFQREWMYFFHVYLDIPWAIGALAKSVLRAPYPWYVCWESQAVSFFEFLLQLTIFGHRVIACCRLAGFNALRNTYRPLSSITVIEFFNRFYYYFKELLVDFFFYPAFFKYFKKHPRLRLIAATFAAAAFGNMYFHFIRDYWIIQKVGLADALANFQVYAFYSVMLAAALCISQLRKREIRPGLLRGRVFPAAGVLFFYLVLDVFGSTERNYPLIEHFRFLGHMFGIDF